MEWGAVANTANGRQVTHGTFPLTGISQETYSPIGLEGETIERNKKSSRFAF
ncbi:hypothetical protein BDB13_1760 [Rhodococcus sp. OK302]|nr:hypothetical protein BDB13_1760 [Rhodococcus sp. OK302]